MSNEAIVKEYRTLNDGTSIPMLGLGVFKVSNEETKQVVLEGLDVGMRIIDTAQAYQNEQGVGDALVSTNVPREDIWVTTKVWNPEQGYDRTRKSVEISLKKLQIPVIDLILIHWPVPAHGLYVETFKALEDLKAEGVVRSIGVSNFQISHLEELKKECKTIPSVNQIEVHPYLTNTDVIEYCNKEGIAVQAWSPLAKAEVLTDEVVLRLASETGKTPAQVVLRWHFQQGILTIPKSSRRERMIQNAEIFDFELSKNQMDALFALNRDYRTGPHPDTFIVD